MDGPPAAPPVYLATPAALAAGAAVRVGDDTLHWRPWAPPVLLNPRAEAVLAAFDGAPLADLVEALADVESRPRDAVAAELELLARHFAGYGLLAGSPQRPRWSPSAMNRPITRCDSTAWNLERADVFDVIVAGRRATCIVGDTAVAAALRQQDHPEVADTRAELGAAPIELILAVEDRPRGMHRLFGRAGRTHLRSTDRDEVVRGFFAHLDTLAWSRTQPEHLWLDAVALQLPRGGIALVAARARYDWARLARPLQHAGIEAVEAPLAAVAFDAGTAVAVIPPAVVDPAIAAIARTCLAGDRPLRKPLGDDRRIRRVDLIATDNELDRLGAAGHDPHDLPRPLAAHAVAELAHAAALDRYPDEPPTDTAATAIVDAAVRLTQAPGLDVAVHSRVADLARTLVDTARAG